MPRVIEVSVPSEQTDRLVAELRNRDDVLGLRLQRGVSLKPPGDIVTISTMTRSMYSLMPILDAYRVGTDSGTNLTTSEPVSLVAPSALDRLPGDESEGTWEEIETAIGKESNATINSLATMAISGFLAAIGLATNALHLVIAAMLIAPGFEPLIRISLGFILKSLAWRRGLVQTAKTYAALLTGALVAAIIVRLNGTSPTGEEEATYLPPNVLVDYWTSFSLTTLLITFVAGMAGAVLVAANRSVLTAGVMVALALVPGATLVMSGLVSGDIDIATRGALRWAHDFVIVVAAAALVFWWKQTQKHRRKSTL